MSELSSIHPVSIDGIPATAQTEQASQTVKEKYTELMDKISDILFKKEWSATLEDELDTYLMQLRDLAKNGLPNASDSSKRDYLSEDMTGGVDLLFKALDNLGLPVPADGYCNWTGGYVLPRVMKELQANPATAQALLAALKEGAYAANPSLELLIELKMIDGADSMLAEKLEKLNEALRAGLEATDFANTLKQFLNKIQYSSEIESQMTQLQEDLRTGKINNDTFQKKVSDLISSSVDPSISVKGGGIILSPEFDLLRKIMLDPNYKEGKLHEIQVSDEMKNSPEFKQVIDSFGLEEVKNENGVTTYKVKDDSPRKGDFNMYLEELNKYKKHPDSYDYTFQPVDPNDPSKGTQIIFNPSLSDTDRQPFVDFYSNNASKPHLKEVDAMLDLQQKIKDMIPALEKVTPDDAKNDPNSLLGQLKKLAAKMDALLRGDSGPLTKDTPIGEAASIYVMFVYSNFDPNEKDPIGGILDKVITAAGSFNDQQKTQINSVNAQYEILLNAAADLLHSLHQAMLASIEKLA